MSLDPWRLQLLTSFAELGTVRAVSHAVSLSPSAVSQQLAVLEREARTTLLERHGRRLVLTPAGQRLVRHARAILDRIREAEQDLVDLGTQPVGPVRIAAFSSALGSLLIPLLAQLAISFPRLEPTTTELEPSASLPLLRNGGCDLAVIAAFANGSTAIDPDIRLIAVTSDPLVAVLPLGHPAAQGTFQLADLSAHRWVLDSEHSYLSDLITALCRRAGFEPQIVGRYQSYGLQLQQVEAGGVVTVLPRMAVDPRYQVATAVLDPPVPREISIAVRAGVAPRPAVQAVIDALTPAVPLSAGR